MSIYPPWGMSPHLFRTFFLEQPSALRLLTSALLCIPESRILSLLPRGPAFPLGSSRETEVLDSLSLTASFSSLSPITLDLFPLKTFSAPLLSPLLPDILSPSAFRPLSLSEDAVFPQCPFYRIFLIFQQSPHIQKFPFYGELLFPKQELSVRLLCLSSLSSASGAEQHSLLFALSHFLFIRHTKELPQISKKFPCLSPLLPPLEEYLRNRELTALFRSQFSSALGSEGMSVMCSLNRLLLRENRISELNQASRDPQILKSLFQEYREKGLL
jgi:hypothetical protein